MNLNTSLTQTTAQNGVSDAVFIYVLFLFLEDMFRAMVMLI